MSDAISLSPGRQGSVSIDGRPTSIPIICLFKLSIAYTVLAGATSNHLLNFEHAQYII